MRSMGRKRKLTGVQRKYAYGLQVKYISHEHYEIRFVANKKNAVEMMKGTDNQYHVYEQIDGQRAVAKPVSSYRLMAVVCFPPNITSVSVWGTDAANRG